jgi:plasmid stability protein
MASLTLTIEEDLLRQARIRALEQGTSVNALVREWLQNYADTDRQRSAAQGFLAVAKRSRASSGAAGRNWTRDDIYEERVGRRAG